MSPTRRLAGGFACWCVLTLGGAAFGQADFVNWETPHVSPLTLTPSGNTLLAVNTADNRLEVFDVSAGTPVHVRSIPVGLDPVSVRARSETQAWVVNHVSDSISIVDLSGGRVVQTVSVGDEPTDVIFAGSPLRAFVTLSQLNQVRVFDPANLATAPIILNIEGEEPRALAASADGSRVFVGIFESGNATGAIRQQDVSTNSSPYGGLNPPPNTAANTFDPPLTPGLPPPPPVAQIVRRASNGAWMDDNNHDWSAFVSWNLHDHDVAIINASSLTITYANSLMTHVMAIGMRPDGQVTVVGTEALNQIRFEPKVQSIFVRPSLGTFDPAAPTTKATADLNPHLTYAVRNVPAATREQSIGDPRGIVWDTTGVGYVAGMGSNNVIVIDSTGGRLGRIDVGEGPTGLAINDATGRLYALNKFAGSVSEIDIIGRVELSRTGFFDPTPTPIKLGRPLLYDTHATSGLGQVSCASCHIDGRTDFLAWDLGNPSGSLKTVNQPCRQPPPQGCRPWHPMKGPMVTQSFQGIVSAPPFHWRGDRENLAAFAPAFTDLQGADAQPSAAQMQQMTDFVATIVYPPNPNRNIDGNLLASLPASDGGTGNPATGLNLYQTLPVLGGNTTCAACHTLPNGQNGQIDDPRLPLAPQALKIVQLRGLHEKTGWRRNSLNNNKGFGFNHHSEFDTLLSLLGAGFAFAPPPAGIQQRRDVEAFMLSLTNDTFAGVGQQVTLDGTNNGATNVVNFFNVFRPLANAGTVGLIAKGRVGGIDRGWASIGNNNLQSDRNGEIITIANLRGMATAGGEITFTVVPNAARFRMGVDRDRDTFFDRDELERCSDPDDAAITPAALGDLNHDSLVNAGDVSLFVGILLGNASPTEQQACTADLNRDGRVDGGDISPFVRCVNGGGCP